MDATTTTPLIDLAVYDHFLVYEFSFRQAVLTGYDASGLPIYRRTGHMVHGRSHGEDGLTTRDSVCYEIAQALSDWNGVEKVTRFQIMRFSDDGPARDVTEDCLWQICTNVTEIDPEAFPHVAHLIDPLNSFAEAA